MPHGMRAGYAGGFFGGQPGGAPLNRAYPEGFLGGTLRGRRTDIGDDPGPAGVGEGGGVGTASGGDDGPASAAEAAESGVSIGANDAGEPGIGPAMGDEGMSLAPAMGLGDPNDMGEPNAIAANPVVAEIDPLGMPPTLSDRIASFVGRFAPSFVGSTMGKAALAAALKGAGLGIPGSLPGMAIGTTAGFLGSLALNALANLNPHGQLGPEDPVGPGLDAEDFMSPEPGINESPPQTAPSAPSPLATSSMQRSVSPLLNRNQFTTRRFGGLSVGV